MLVAYVVLQVVKQMLSLLVHGLYAAGLAKISPGILLGPVSYSCDFVELRVSGLVLGCLAEYLGPE